MNAVITGTFGFIGLNLHIKARNIFKKITSIEEGIFQSEDWQQHLISVLDINTPSVVFHVGACSDTLQTDVNYMMTRNYEFTKVLVDWCKSNKVPVVYSSSASSYGVNGKHPSNLYGWSKYAAEDYVVNNGGVALRYFNVYGPRENHKGRMASVAYQMYVRHKEEFPIKLFPGKPSRDFVYVEDVVDANLYAAEHFKDLKGKYYDVGVGKSETFEDVLSILGIPYKYNTKKSIPEGYQFYTCSDKNKWMPGWKPKFSLKEGLLEYKKYLDENVPS